MISWFLKVSIAEGISLLLLFFVAMPLKYFWAMPEAVTLAGSVHGALFLIYFFFLLPVAHKEKWSLAFYLWALFCSVIPLGFVFLAKTLKTTETASLGDAA